MTRIQLYGPIIVDGMSPTPRSVLDGLRQMLAAGVDAAPDEHRPNFYTVNEGGRNIYFYISPVSAKVWVLEYQLAGAAAAASAGGAARPS